MKPNKDGPHKVKLVTDWSPKRNVKELKQFIGFENGSSIPFLGKPDPSMI